MTPSTCKNVLGVLIPVGIRDTPILAKDATTRVHIERVAVITAGRRAKLDFFLVQALSRRNL